VATDNLGQFSQELVFDSPGIHFLRVVYSGGEFYEPLEFKEEFPSIAAQVKTLRVDALNEVVQ